MIQEAYVQGISTRSVDDLVKAMGMSGISKSQVSRLCEEIDGKVKAFLSRPLEGDWPYLWIDATYFKVRHGGRIVSVAAIIAIGVNTDGRREMLGLEIGTSEGGAPIRVAHCWAHARRKLKEVFDRDGSEIAAEGLRRIAELYAVEADIRGISPGQRLSARQARTAPLVAAFGDWLQAQRRKISSKSRLGEKLAYIHNQRDGLQTFLTDGRVEIDSNRVENLIRPIAHNRKNALFAGHDEGGIAWGRIASLIETCKINGIEPFAYLKATLTAIATGHPQSRLDDLLPWNFSPSR